MMNLEIIKKRTTFVITIKGKKNYAGNQSFLWNHYLYVYK